MANQYYDPNDPWIVSDPAWSPTNTAITPTAAGIIPEAYDYGAGNDYARALNFLPAAQREDIVMSNLPATVQQGSIGALLPALLSTLKIGGAAATAAPAIGGILAGLFGANALDLFGNNPQQTIGGNIPLGGPGLAEPPANMVVKEWRANGAQFYKLLDGRIAVYSTRKGRWKVYRPARNLVISRNPKVRDLLSVSGKVDKLMKSLAKKSPVLRYGRAASKRRK